MVYSTNLAINLIIAFLFFAFYIGMSKYSGRDSNLQLQNTTRNVGTVVKYQPIYGKVGQFGQFYELIWHCE